MNDLPPASRLLTNAPASSHGSVTLDYDARLMRRKRLVTAAGEGFLVDLPAVTNLDSYWGFELEDGRAIRIVPAVENVLLITGDLARLAWHIGNRHTPCEMHETYLLIREDHVLEGMLRGLGARITRVSRPFAPESGAYGTGRTMGHDHGHSHSHAPGTPFHSHDHHSHDGHIHHHGAHFHGGDEAE
ncbi:urease accessory protein UreE [Pararhodobacter aggregans]|uniref:Urease accessory protein UreE n=1 Tax=Pararhodobacter aggregans TaxID=404875 RepID=A0A2T7UR17_9RHOB|nr:urease accessory protein UreE [Pararhodobacter aggregans]PTX01941.1 urease accessory protein [Pararhodobacter aggregans]PVE47127.1 urease accessory protein UreE [Pararhodobacter aggregans]